MSKKVEDIVEPSKKLDDERAMREIRDKLQGHIYRTKFSIPKAARNAQEKFS